MRFLEKCGFACGDVKASTYSMHRLWKSSIDGYSAECLFRTYLECSFTFLQRLRKKIERFA